MSSSTEATPKTIVILNGPADWPSWDREFTATMAIHGLLPYFQGTKELLAEPDEDFNAFDEFEAYRSAELLKVAQPLQPITPTTSINEDDDGTQSNTLQTSTQGNEGPDSTTTTTTNTTKASDLQARIEQRKREIDALQGAFVAQANARYTAAVRRHDIQTQRLAKAIKHFNTTVSQQLRDAHCPGHRDLRTWYRNLKEASDLPSDTNTSIRTRLADHLNSLQKNKHLKKPDLTAWLTTWESLLQLMHAHGMPEPTTTDLWFNPLMAALRAHFPGFVQTYRIQCRPSYESLNYRTVSRDIKASIDDLIQPVPNRVGKGAFASFGGQQQPEQQSNSSTTPNKRKRPTEQCRACGHIHPTTQCYYLYPDKAPPNWEAREHVRQRVRANVQANPSLK
ncbi:hypothetical protein N657DRAFT_584565, partial [Parathielavia appendiculata]